MRVVRTLLLLVLLVVLLCGAAAWYLSSRGFSARATPTAFEEAVALRLRNFATPPDARTKQNPVAATPEVIREGLEHFADHCAICHSNDGSGRSDFGDGLYPKPPDLRAARTQTLGDGELFYIIENGVRFTGMPAFGGHDSAEDIWELVRFIRHLPELTPDELARMKTLNPAPRGEHEEHDEQNVPGTKPPSQPTKHPKS